MGSPVRCGVCNVLCGLQCVVGSALRGGVYSVLSCLRCAVGSVVYYGVYTVLWGLHGAWDLQCVVVSSACCGVCSAVGSAVYRRLCRVVHSPIQFAKACDDSGASRIATLSVLCQISPINSKFPFKIRLGTDKK